MTTRKPYKKRLQEHQRETRQHAKLLERRIKKLGGATERVPGLISRGAAMAKGPLHMARGTGEEEKLLKNAKTEYSEEHEEIATYTAIEAFAEKVGDKETAKLARQIRRDEQKMANYLERLIPTLTNAVVTAEIPASERSNGRRSVREEVLGEKSSSRKASARKRSSSRNGRSRSGSRSRAKSRSDENQELVGVRGLGGGRLRFGGGRRLLCVAAQPARDQRDPVQHLAHRPELGGDLLVEAVDAGPHRRDLVLHPLDVARRFARGARRRRAGRWPSRAGG